MTIKEKLMKERPELDEDYFRTHCPDMTNTIPSKKCKCVGRNYIRYATSNKSTKEMCEDCWNQKVRPSAVAITLIVIAIAALIFTLTFVGVKVFDVGKPVDNGDNVVVETFETVDKPITEEPLKTIEEPLIFTETSVDTVDGTTVETLVETATKPATDVISKPVVDSVGTLPKGETVILTATAYCGENYPHICNNGDPTKTATGVRPTAGRTIAVDPRMIPYGSRVLINGVTYVAEDCGGAIKGNRIDIFFDTHQEALQWGRRTVEAIILD